MSLDTYKFRFSSLLGRLEHLKEIVSEEREKLLNLKDKISHTETAQKLLQEVAQAVQESAHNQISSVVTRCLETIGFDYEFKILFEQKRGKTEARLVFYKDDNEVDPMSGSGGGPKDIAAFALRVACLILSFPSKRKVLILDEPFKNLSPEYQHKVPKLLEILSKEMEIQFILTTNMPTIQAGRVIEL